MEPSHDHIEKTLDKLVASTRSPRGRYSASESWKLLERRLVPPRTKRLRLFRLAGVVAASVLLCFASWFIYDYWKPVAMQTVSAGAAISVITLPDQTKVTLNRYSSLTYPDRFKEDRREVQLQGEAYFEVAHDTQKPFVVSTEDMSIRVLGTKFNVKAYAEDEAVYTTLVSGSVRTNNKQSTYSTLLSPNEQCIYYPGNNRMETRKIDPQTFLGWVQGRFIFENETLEEILKQLGRWYDTEIFYQNPRVAKYRFTGNVDRFDQISTLLHMIEKTYPVSFTINGRTIVVK